MRFSHTRHEGVMNAAGALVLGLFLRRTVVVLLFFAVLSLTLPAPMVYAQASVEITDLQYPAQVALGSSGGAEVPVTFSVSWAGANPGDYLDVFIFPFQVQRILDGRVELPSSCIPQSGVAGCRMFDLRSSGRDYAKFVAYLYTAGKHRLVVSAALYDAQGNIRSLDDGQFYVEVSSTTTTTTSSIETTGFYGDTSTSISDLQYPAHVALGTSFPIEIRVTFTFSWTGARSGDHLVLGIARSGTDDYAGGRAYLPASCLTPGEDVGTAVCVKSNLESSGRGSAEFHLWVYSQGKYDFASLVGMCDTYGNVREGSLTSREFSVEVSPTTTTITTTTSTTVSSTTWTTTTSFRTETAKTTAPQWLTDYWPAITFGAIVAAVLLVLYLLTRRKKVVPQAPIEHPTPIAAAETKIGRPPSKSTMFCRECGAKIPRGSKHCQKCGAKLT